MATDAIKLQPGPAMDPHGEPVIGSAGAAAEWRRNWLLVLAGVAGMSISGMVPYSLGLFMDPLTQAFGWNRSIISVGPTVIAVFGIVLTPVIGILCDRFGSRRIAVPGVILVSLAFAALGLTSASPIVWIALWCAYSMAFVAVKPLVWSTAISRAFDRSRGLALAVVLCGVTISQTLTPIITEWLIRTKGWREAFHWLGLGWGGVVLVVVVLFFREARTAPARADVPLAGHGRRAAAGPPLRDNFDANVIKITIAAILLAAVGAGIAVHKVPILVEFGVDRSTAAWLAATAGVSGIAGKLLTGWLMDRTETLLVPGLAMAINGIGVALLLPAGHPPALIVAAMLLVGFGAGSSLQVTVYLLTRFSDRENFGGVMGVVFAAMAIGTGGGPWLFGTVYAVFASYQYVLIAAVPVCAGCGLLVMTLTAPRAASPSNDQTR